MNLRLKEEKTKEKIQMDLKTLKHLNKQNKSIYFQELFDDSYDKNNLPSANSTEVNIKKHFQHKNESETIIFPFFFKLATFSILRCF